MSYAAEVLADAPAIFYRCQEASGQLQDSSGNARHTTVASGTVTYGQASPIITDGTAKSILFSGTQKFTTPDVAGLDLGDVWTVEFWTRRNPLPGTFDQPVDKGSNAYALAVSDTNTLVMQASGTATLRHTAALLTSTSTWYHCVGTKSGSSCFLYVNAADATVFDFDTTTTDTATALMIGDSTFTGSPYHGNLTEVAVYPTALSSTRVRAHYTAATTEPGNPYAKTHFGPF